MVLALSDGDGLRFRGYIECLGFRELSGTQYFLVSQIMIMPMRGVSLLKFAVLCNLADGIDWTSKSSDILKQQLHQFVEYYLEHPEKYIHLRFFQKM